MGRQLLQEPGQHNAYCRGFFLNLFLENMAANDPLKMFEPETDINLVYDLDKVTLQKIKMLAELGFFRQCNLLENHYTSCILKDYFLSQFKKVYRECQQDIIYGLKGEMTFYAFRDLFVSFF